ncbi:hypothetical protein N7537_001511 [Penicillium hordei]|uniref:Uncharacterized protein n=1 Tax=Penicillium hordei TaxID=40994 RepID=A0AAD6H894_9EURO|nr:uncharacterized protein N7537_001511 [Penicillium hordei]KAJ5616397.1 hypothetical protein N7537_001511 [Penicillium hordei]
MAGLMSSAGAYMRRLWKNESPSVRVCLFGSGGAGKTTLLYRLIEGRQVTTVPTIGFNLENLHVPSEGVDFEIWEWAGGCSSLPLSVFEHVVHSEVICLFIIDASDQYDYVKYDLDHVINRTEEAKHFAVIFNHKVQNSQVDATALKKMVNDRIRSRQGSGLYGPTCAVYDDLDRFNAATGEQLDILLSRLIHVAKTNKPHLREEPATKVVLPNSSIPKPSKQELLRRIEDRSKESVHQLPPDQFVKQMIAGTLSTWDHMCHLRAGFLCLMESIMEEDVVFAAAELFLRRLDAMLRASPGKFRNTFHRTLTIFWMHQIHVQMLVARQKTGVLPSYNSFTEFLRQCPELMDGQGWDQYWTKEILFGHEAREAWVLPDLKSLARYTPSSQPNKPKKKAQAPRTNIQIYQRFAYGIVKTVKSTDQRRATIINDTLPIIQSYLTQLRAQSQSIGSNEPYSLTQAYFWIQMMHVAVASIPPAVSVDITKLSFESFGTLFPDLVGAEDLWTEYYTPQQWNSVEARMRTVLPRKKNLPNFFPPPSQAQMDKAIASRLDEKYAGPDEITYFMDGRPSAEELFLRVRWAVKSTTVTDGKHDEYDGTMDSHAALLRYVFNRLILTDSTSTSGKLVSQAVWEEMSFLHRKGQYTCAVFWARMILAAFARTDAAFRKNVDGYRGMVEETEMEAAETRLFSHFLSASMELCWERLWATYYSDEMWKSKDAAVGYVLPDKRPLPAYIEERLN